MADNSKNKEKNDDGLVELNDINDQSKVNNQAVENRENERKKELDRIKAWIEDRRAKMEQSAKEKQKDNPNKDLVDNQKDNPQNGPNDSQKDSSKDSLKDNANDSQKDSSKDSPKDIEKTPQFMKSEMNTQMDTPNDINKPEVKETQTKKYPKEVANQILFERDRASKFSNSTIDYARAKLRLDYLEKLPWIPDDFEPIDVDYAKKILQSEHFGMDKVKDEIIEYIYALNKMGKVSSETLLLSGPPGTGKTSIVRQIAKALDREFIKIPLGGLADEIYLRGTTTQYSSSKPGAIIDALMKIGHRKIVILLDEVDKLSQKNSSMDGASALLDLLDHDNAFMDRFINIPMMMNDVVFIATANEVLKIPAPLMDRMTEIEIQAYTKIEKLEICKRFLLPKAKELYGLEKRLKVEQKVLKAIVDEDSQNSGVRSIDAKVRKICKVAARVTEENHQQTFVMNYKRAVEHGIIAFHTTREIKDYAIGKVVTSAIDAISGKENLVSIEALYVSTLKAPEIIGRRKDLYKDDAMLLWSYIVAQKNILNLQDQSFDNGSFAINIQEVERYRCDANHRLAMFFAMYANMIKIVLPRNHVVIGDVSLLGEVKSNCMTKAHIANALNCGADVLFVPADMEKQLTPLVKEMSIQLFPIKNLNQLREMFQRLYVLNRINDKVVKEPQTMQAPIDQLIEHETQIRTLVKEKELTLREAYARHFSEKPNEEKNQSVEELTNLIGLLEVKSIVENIIRWKVFTKKRIEKGFKSKDIGLHMVFTGNPGTGKTTVAKILGKMLYDKELSKTDRFIEVTRDDLVGKYIGHTEDRVKNVIKQAMGGILYVDEAHSLFMDSENDYGKIVISTLVKEMEENRDNLIVIMSGYKKEMSEMIRINPGLEDRINFKINFEDYSATELVEIFLALCEEEAYEVSEDVREELYNIFEGGLKSKGNRNKNFSNGRFVRNLFEKTKMQQAMRCGEKKEEIEDAEFGVLRIEDVQRAFSDEVRYKGFEDGGKQMGFV